MNCSPGAKPDQLRQSCKQLCLEVMDWSHPLAIVLLIVSLLGATYDNCCIHGHLCNLWNNTTYELPLVILGSSMMSTPKI